MPPFIRPVDKSRHRATKRVGRIGTKRKHKIRNEAQAGHLKAKKAIPQLKHKSYIEIVENEDRRDKKLEFQSTYDATPPPGFGFLPIGYPDLTNLCKEMSRDKGAMIFVVLDKRYTNELSAQVNRSGYYVREYILEAAKKQLGIVGNLKVDELPTSQEEINRQADSALRDLFPRIPNTDRQEIIDRAFRLGATFKGEPTVGTQPGLPLSRRVQLAVLAHIRHNHTRYDELLKEASWAIARKAVELTCLEYVIRWRGDEENGRDDLDEILREVVIISDDEDDSGGEEEDEEDDEDSQSCSDDSDYDPEKNLDGQKSKTETRQATSNDAIIVSSSPVRPPQQIDGPVVQQSPRVRRRPLLTSPICVPSTGPRRYQVEISDGVHWRDKKRRAYYNDIRSHVIQSNVDNGIDHGAPMISQPKVISVVYPETVGELREMPGNARALPGVATRTSPSSSRPTTVIAHPQPQKPKAHILAEAPTFTSTGRRIRGSSDNSANAEGQGKPIPKVNDLLVQSIEVPPDQKAIFVRAVSPRRPGINAEGKRAREPSYDCAPYNENSLESPLASSADNSPRKRARYNHYPTGGRPVYHPGEVAHAVRPASRLTPEGDPYYRRQRRPMRALREYELSPQRPAPRPVYYEPVYSPFPAQVHRAQPHYYVDHELVYPHSRSFPGPPVHAREPAGYVDSYHLVPPQPGQHDNGAWRDQYQSHPPTTFVANRIEPPRPVHAYMPQRVTPPTNLPLDGPPLPRAGPVMTEPILLHESKLPPKTSGDPGKASDRRISSLNTRIREEQARQRAREQQRDAAARNDARPDDQDPNGPQTNNDLSLPYGGQPKSKGYYYNSQGYVVLDD